MSSKGFRNTWTAVFISFVLIAFLLTVYFMMLRGNDNVPDLYKLIYLGVSVFIPGLWLFLALHTDLREYRFDKTGTRRSALLERVQNDPRRSGTVILSLRFDDTGERFDWYTRTQVGPEQAGKRLWVLVDKSSAERLRPLLRTLGEATPPRPADDGEKVFDGPLNDAMLVQEREESARRRESGSSGEGRSAAHSGGKSSSKGKKNK